MTENAKDEVRMKRYDKEFREQAQRLSDEVGPQKACEQLGVLYSTLADWRKQRVRSNNAKQKHISNPEDEITRLKRENNELQHANSILKNAHGFFVVVR